MISPDIQDKDIDWSKIGGDPLNPQSDLTYVGKIGPYHVEKVISKSGEHYEFAYFDESRKIKEIEFDLLHQMISFLNKSNYDTP